MTKPNFAGRKYREFRFDAGSLALNFVATLRHRGSVPRELLVDGESLLRWFSLAGLVVGDAAVAALDLREARKLRESIHSVALSRLEARPLDKNDVETINRHAAMSELIPILKGGSAATSPRIVWSSTAPIQSCLASVARDAVKIVGSSDISRLNRCAHESCRMIFLDASAARKRKWCSMGVCGNREKVAVHRQRKRGAVA